MKKYEMDMCTGSLWKKIGLFSIPLMFSNILQVIFNIADVAVVGRYAGSIPLGAVGSTTILITLFTGLLIGLSSGINALVALYIGAKNQKSTQETVHTGFIVCLTAGVFIMLTGIFCSNDILALLNTKDELIKDAAIYLKLYLTGMPAMALYNFGNAVLSASGDTKRPLFILSFAGMINIVLNLFFVIVCRWSSAGVGCSSAISQYISAILIISVLLKNKDEVGLKIHNISIQKEKLRDILRIGIPASFQFIIFAIANLFVQTGVNSFDHVVVEGNAAAANADPLVYEMMAAFYTACASFIAQNYGARNKKRMWQTYFICVLYSLICGLLLGIGIYIFRYGFLALFTKDSLVIQAGIKRISIMTFSYGISSFMDCTLAASRGIGKTVVPTIFVIAGSCVFRVAWIYTIFQYFHTIESLYLLYVFSWILTGAAEIFYFVASMKKVGN